MRNLTFCLLLAAAFAAVQLPAADAEFPVDLSGAWKLNVSRSSPGVPISALDIRDSAKEFEFTATQIRGGAEQKSSFKLIKGKETAFKDGDVEGKTLLRYDGKVLCGETVFERGDRQIRRSERMSLSEDGKVLEILLRFENGDDSRLVFDRQ